MGALTYIRLVGFTAGTLLQLFWMVVILGYRRQRNLERAFFLLCLSLFLFYAGSLLALNAQIYYAQPPATLRLFSMLMAATGLLLAPPSLWHLHLEFAETRGFFRNRRWRKQLELFIAYAGTAFLAVYIFRKVVSGQDFDFVLPLRSMGIPFTYWICAVIAVCSRWDNSFGKESSAHEFTSRVKPEILFFRLLSAFLLISAISIFLLHGFHGAGAYTSISPSTAAMLGTILALLPILPLTFLIYMVQRHNFLQFGRQKNLLYAISATFVALLYLSLVRRIGTWLEPILPPEASAAILLFVLVVFIEPLQRILGQTLRETAKRELELVQGVAQEILEEAKHGDLPRLVQFTEEETKKTFELSAVNLVLGEKAIAGVQTGGANQPSIDGLIWRPPYFPISRGGVLLGLLKAEPHGSALSGDTRGAIEYLCEQLPSALDLCRLIEEKLQLERELAERERMALVGQTAASISHNLKNPLGSIKTILQVQLENPEMPESMRGETRMVLEEVSRLSAKLNQLLQFSRPAVRGGEAPKICDAPTVLREVANVLRPEAERRGVKLGLEEPAGGIAVTASAEALNDIVSNLVVNALEASASGGNVLVSGRSTDHAFVITVEDDGPGIPQNAREKILQPFFTTKSQGTGLGLAIVARRVGECGGKLEWQSPIENGCGTRFQVSLPAAKEKE